MIGTRMAYKNYMAFVNPGEEPIPSYSIQSQRKDPSKASHFLDVVNSTPIQNDPKMRTIKATSPYS